MNCLNLYDILYAHMDTPYDIQYINQETSFQLENRIKKQRVKHVYDNYEPVMEEMSEIIDDL